ncbi:hypothetical protein L0F63_000482, partial [Massospora cicadina]
MAVAKGLRSGPWVPTHELVQTLECLLSIPTDRFQLLRRVAAVSQRILGAPGDPPITAQSLAVVLPVIPAHAFIDVAELKLWNLTWGRLLDHAGLLFADPGLYLRIQPSARARAGYRYAQDVLATSGI